MNPFRAIRERVCNPSDTCWYQPVAAWLTRHNLNDRQAGQLLGCGKDKISDLRRGQRPRRYDQLAMAAIDMVMEYGTWIDRDDTPIFFWLLERALANDEQFREFREKFPSHDIERVIRVLERLAFTIDTSEMLAWKRRRLYLKMRREERARKAACSSNRV